MGIFRTVSTRETQWWQNQCSSMNRCKVIHEKPSDKNQTFDPGEIWPLEPKRLTLGQFWRHVSDREFHCASARFWNLLLAALVWAPHPFKCWHALFAGKCDNFPLMTSFDPLKRDLGGQKLHHKEFIYTATHNQNFSFLRGPGAEITGGASGAPPRQIPNFFLPARNRVKC